MNRLPTGKRCLILSMLVEGMSIRSVCRISGSSINTVLKLLVDAGEACADYHDRTVRNVRASHIQADEIWSFCYAKDHNVAAAKAAPVDAGDVWTWTALDTGSRMILAWRVGDRTVETGRADQHRCAARLPAGDRGCVRRRRRLRPNGQAEGTRQAEEEKAVEAGEPAAVDVSAGPACAPDAVDRGAAPGHRPARSRERRDVACRAVQSDDPDGQPPIQPPDQRALEDDREPPAHAFGVLHALQFLSDPRDAAMLAGDGRRRHRYAARHGLDRALGRSPAAGADEAWA